MPEWWFTAEEIELHEHDVDLAKADIDEVKAAVQAQVERIEASLVTLFVDAVSPSEKPLTGRLRDDQQTRELAALLPQLLEVAQGLEPSTGETESGQVEGDRRAGSSGDAAA